MKTIDFSNYLDVLSGFRKPWHGNYYAMYSSVLGGVVLDPVSGRPAEYVAVGLRKRDGALVESTVTDNQGATDSEVVKRLFPLHYRPRAR